VASGDRAATRFAILVLPSFSNMTLAAVMEPLRVANRVAGRTLFTWAILTESGQAVPSSSGLRIVADASLDTAGVFDVLFVVASFDADRHTSPRVRQFIRRAARAGLRIGGMESAAYVLASAGVLDRYRATTHWEDLADLGDRYPAIEVVQDRFVIDRTRMTSGGALPTLDLMLELLQRELGPSLALSVASAFIYDRDHAGHDPQPMRTVGRLAWRDPAVVRAIRQMERNIETPVAVSELAREAGIGARELHRRFVAALRTSPQAYYAELRLQLARRLLEHTDHPVSRVAMMSGFASGSAFARAFRVQHGMSPSAVRRGS
jgi:transcriptional regulator GlxA family with amidase domain